MACTSGKDGVVKIGTTTVAAVRSWTVTENADTVDCSHMGNNGWRTFQAGMNTWEGNVDIVWDEATPQDDLADLTVGGNVTLTLYPAPDNYAVPDTGDYSLTGSIIITSMELTATYDGLVEASVSFTGTDALTRVAAV